MPSAEETTYLIEVMPADTTQDFLSRDVDLLVSRIKENLRLSGFKAKSTVTHNRNRSSPYRIPSRSSWVDEGSMYEICSTKNRSLLEQQQQQQRNHNNYHHHHLHHQQQQQHRCHCRHRHNGQHHKHCPHSHYRRSHRNSKRHGGDSKDVEEEEDPYELLQELLREGGLIKEAVKRLQANLEEFEERSEEEDDDHEEDEELDDDDETAVVDDDEVVDGVRERTNTTASTFYRKKPYFYDSEDEPLPSSVYESLKP